MSALSKLTAAFASATNELTIAAANFSFDFSLVKVEAPVEFHGLGKGLSDQRRMDAESGVPHITARKLGALFNDVPPRTPELVKAYGRRVSEIAEVPALNPRANDVCTVFSNHVGADGTSIWAAATSGPGALQIQLLTCMLARLWDGPEAVSVWVELVKERKKEIAKLCEDGHAIPYGTLMSTQQNISRSQLAEWDASARAWLRTADQAKILQQKQLLLVIDNLDISVSNDMKVYSSVLSAWTTALQALERLVTGMPQSLHQNGAILLGLSAWHLYPDLLILKESITKVTFDDPLVKPGGALTIGMYKASDQGPQGVYWSLSLAHLRYYGNPVVRKRAIARESSRITFDQLIQVALGSLSKCWSEVNSPINPLELVEFLAALGTLLDSNKALNATITSKEVLALPDWLFMLIKASKTIIKASGAEYETAVRLLNVGLKHGKEFLATNDDSIFIQSAFGLKNLEILLPMLDGTEWRVWLLRQVAARLDFQSKDVIIRYLVYPEQSTPSETRDNVGDMTSSPSSCSLDLNMINQEDETTSDEEMDQGEEIDSNDSTNQEDGPDQETETDGEVRSLDENENSSYDEMVEPSRSSQSEHQDEDIIFRKRKRQKKDRNTLEVGSRVQSRVLPIPISFTGHKDCHIEYATALPRPQQPNEQNSHNNIKSSPVHQRWVIKEAVEAHQQSRVDSSLMCDCIGSCREDFCACYRRNLKCTADCQPSLQPIYRRHCWNTEASTLLKGRLDRIQRCGDQVILMETDFLGSETGFAYNKTKEQVVSADTFSITGFPSKESKTTKYQLLAGDRATAAIYTECDSLTYRRHHQGLYTSYNHGLTMQDLTHLIRSNGIHMNKLISHFHIIGQSGPTKTSDVPKAFEPGFSEKYVSRQITRGTELYRSLEALVAASKVYDLLPNTTIAIESIQKPIFSRHWARDFSNIETRNSDLPTSLRPPRMLPNLSNLLAPLGNVASRIKRVKELSRVATFSCLALFESGHCDINLDLLKDVMALSSGDSIYVAAPLLCDPYEIKKPYELLRVIGNIGRPGITMLVPPANPLMRQVGLENWNVVTHADFDGKKADSFQGTTMHLSFTEYNQPVNIGVYGAQDAEVFVIESVLSVYDHGKWVADLDVLRALESNNLHRIQDNGQSCKHCPPPPLYLPSSKITAVDSWEEFLDPPANSSVARAYGNWVARLSLAAIGVTQRPSHKVFVCSESFCWKCFEELEGSLEGKTFIY